ncbi:MAG: nitroreductase family deazaflavin-dependent oxidoreductase [Acidimicrobiales bacterium]
MEAVNAWNQKVIEEFRANSGKCGGPFEGAPMLLLHTTGTKTGIERINPLVYLPDNDNFVVFASFGGAPQNPAWFNNLVAQPKVTIEHGTETIDVKASITAGEERARFWNAQKAAMPQFAEYEANTTREIPVIVLERSR